MPDAFEALRAPITPVVPDPAFAASLRDRVNRQLHQGGIRMPLAQSVLEPAPMVPTPVVVPYLIVQDGRRAIEWYTDALGARLRTAPMVMPDRRIGHAELDFGGGVVYLAEVPPDSRVAAPRPGEPAAVSLTAQVPDVDAAVDRAIAAGAELQRPAADNPYGRNAVIVDPFGHRWILSAAEATFHPSLGGSDIGAGDVTYSSLWVPDVERARAFFGAVLGWSFSEQGNGRALAVEGATPRHGLWPEPGRPSLFLCYAVPDLRAASARVVAAGGTVERMADETYGRTADCVDDQGTRFALHEGTAATTGVPRVRHDSGGDGDIAYVTLEVRDALRARAFYGTVLGWRFTPGRSRDGWNVEGVVPMVGVSGGHDAATAIPMYRVGHIHAAVERVRTAGGMATDPELQPYGITADCGDDQGTRFSLGQLP